MSALIEFDEVCKYYQMGDTTVKAADHITMKIDKGEFVAIVGQSGSGKSTCMNIIGCLDVPTYGTYRLNGRDVGKMNRNELAAVRNEMLGFIFQQYNLLPRLNLMENVEVPLVYAGIGRTERHARAVLRLPENRRSEALITIAKRRLNARQTDSYIEQLLNRPPKAGHRISMVRDVRIFVNTIDHAIRLMTDNGVPATAHREERDGYIEYTVRIPTAAAEK